MMAKRWRCLDEIEQAIGRKLGDDEADDLLSELQRRARQKRAEGATDDFNDALGAAAEEYAQEMAAAAAIEKRNAAINLTLRLRAVDKVRTHFADDPVLGLEAINVGINNPRPGARLSAAASQKELTKKYLSGLIADLSRNDLWGVFVSGAMDREIARAMWARNRAEKLPTDYLPREAVEIADVLSKWQEAARLDANKAGAWIKRMPGYIVRQSHDLYRIQRAGFDAWRADIGPRLDWDRIEAEHPSASDRAGFLRAAYDGIVSGVHLKAGAPEPSGFKGPRNIAKKMSAERILHFKSADDWFDYNQAFGARTLSEAVVQGLDLAGQNTGLMRVWGTNPEANFRLVVEELLRDMPDPVKKRALANAADRMGRLTNQMAELDGTTRVPVNAMAARIAGVSRAVANMAKLGFAVFSQASDLALHASNMRYSGMNYLEQVDEGLRSIGRGFGDKDRQELYGMIGVVFDAMRGDVMSRHAAAHDDLPGMVAWLQQSFFKANLMQPWTDRLRAGAASALAHQLALNTKVPYAGLKPELTRALNLYGIGEAEWGIIARTAQKQVDGRAYVIPDAIAELPDSVFADLAKDRGKKASVTRIAELKGEIASKLRTYITDRADISVSIPDARTRAMMIQGMRPGTVWGEVARFLSQFKTFSGAVVVEHLGREAYGRGASTLREALRGGNGELLGLAQVILGTTVAGYVTMAVKDLAKGRTPRNPLDWKTWGAAMVQGGGLGIYGDFLLGQSNRHGRALLDTLAGPVVGTIADLDDLRRRLMAGDDAAAFAFRTALSNTPFANLFYTRIALDYLFLYQLQEALSPGSLRRLERRIKKENGQHFLVPPSQWVR
jgi:hypothetical protein